MLDPSGLPEPVPTRVTVQISDPDGDATHLDELTRRLRQELLGLDIPVEVAGGEQAPPGARGIELVAIGTLLLTIAQSPVLASVIDAVSTWLGNRRNRTVKLEIGGDVIELSGVGGTEQRRLVDAWLNRNRGEQHASLGAGRHALIVANHDYQDEGLRRLRAPAHDADQLARVLRDPAIGGFDVTTLLNESAPVINEKVEEFFADRTPDELLLLYFSGHGVKDEDGELYFAAAPTKLNRLAATAVAADFVNRRMNRSRSRRIVLLLDCCYAGAFSRGMVPRGGAGVGLDERFGGRGRAVITASSAMEYAFEGDSLSGASGPSVFTGALVEGLRTGDADRDHDGFISLDELYDYIHDRVTAATPNQSPGKWTFDLQGDLYIARRATPAAMALPHGLQHAVDHQLSGVRAGAVTELEKLLHGGHPGLALAARLALQHLANDDSRSVSAAASAALHTRPHAQAPPPRPTAQRAQGTTYPPQPPPVAAPRFSGLAIVSPLTAVAILLTAPFIPTVLALAPIPVVLGHLARRAVRRKGRRGGGLAVAGLVLGYLSTAWLIVVIGGTIEEVASSAR